MSPFQTHPYSMTLSSCDSKLRVEVFSSNDDRANEGGILSIRILNPGIGKEKADRRRKGLKYNFGSYLNNVLLSPTPGFSWYHSQLAAFKQCLAPCAGSRSPLTEGRKRHIPVQCLRFISQGALKPKHNLFSLQTCLLSGVWIFERL